MSLRTIIIGMASAVCVVPSFAMTVLPTASHDLPLAAAMALATLCLPLVPFAIRRAHGYITRVFLAALGLGLLAFNFSNAVDALNRSHVAAADVNARLAELTARRNAIPAHGIASKSAVEDARRARDIECGNGLGPRCRAREDALSAAQRDHAASERALTVEADFDAATAAQTALAPTEATAKQTASQLSDIAGVPGDKIAKHRPVFKALIVEALGGFAPWLMVLVFGSAPPKPLPKAKPGEVMSVPEWFAQAIEKRHGRRLRAKKAFASYRAWCQKNKREAVNQTVFGNILKRELKVEKKRSRGLTHYLNVGLSADWDFLIAEMSDHQIAASRAYAEREASRAPPDAKPKLTVVEGGQSREGASASASAGDSGCAG